MKLVNPLALALTVALGAPVAAQVVGGRPIEKGTPVEIVGEISSQPRDFGFFHESKMQVAVGPEKTDHTLHLREAKIFDENGREIAKSDLQDKWWVRAEGTVQDDPRRIKVTRLTLIGKDWDTYRQSAAFRPGMERGYVIAENVAGSRQVLPSTRVFAPGTRVVVIAPISSQPRDAGVAVEEKMQVAIGPEKTDYTLHFKDAVMTGLDGQRVYASGLRDRMWVRAEGTVMDDSQRIQVDRLRVIASDEAGFQQSPEFRPGVNYGTIMAVE